jgi:hypothetical protein
MSGDGRWHRVEAKWPPPVGGELARIEQTPDGLIWLGHGSHASPLTARQLATLRAMLNRAAAGERGVWAMRLEGDPPRLYVGDGAA